MEKKEAGKKAIQLRKKSGRLVSEIQNSQQLCYQREKSQKW